MEIQKNKRQQNESREINVFLPETIDRKT